jgi:hypothetical protein
MLISEDQMTKEARNPKSVFNSQRAAFYVRHSAFILFFPLPAVPSSRSTTARIAYTYVHYSGSGGLISREKFNFWSEVLAVQRLNCDFNYLQKSPPLWVLRGDFQKGTT